MRGYWLIFVIVAVGLVLSWGQVGRKAERVVTDTPVQMLQVEDDCRPLRAPCAALGRDRALVLGPGSGGVILRTTGVTLPVREIEVLALAADGEATALVPLGKGDTWVLDRLPSAALTLRVSLHLEDGITVAEFSGIPGRVWTFACFALFARYEQMEDRSRQERQGRQGFQPFWPHRNLCVLGVLGEIPEDVGLLSQSAPRAPRFPGFLAVANLRVLALLARATCLSDCRLAQAPTAGLPAYPECGVPR